MKHAIAMIGGLLMAGVADAHVSHASGMAHAMEHFWLLLAPLLLLLRPLARQLVRNRKRD